MMRFFYLCLLSLPFFLSCDKNEPATGRDAFVGNWKEITFDDVFYTDSLGHLTDTIRYQATVQLLSDNSYTTLGERPLGINSAGRWAYREQPAQLLFLPNSFPGLPPVDTVIWNVLLQETDDFSVEQKKTIGPAGGTLEITSFRQFKRE